jgi:DNA excision repair protein ERCC-2
MPLVESGKKLIIAYRTRNQLDIYLKELKAITRKSKKEHLAVSVISKEEMCPRFRGESMSYSSLIYTCKTLRENSRKGVEPSCEYFDKILREEDWVYDFILRCSKKLLSPHDVFKRASRRKVCPYEALKLIMPEAEIFLGTYHYLFHPDIRQEILRLLEVDLSECVAIVDEAHNLPNFARELLSGELSWRTLDQAVREATEFGGDEMDYVVEIVESIKDILLPKFSKGLKPNQIRRLDPTIFKEQLEDLIGERAEILAQEILSYGEFVWDEKLKLGKRVYSYNHRVGEFLSAFIEAIGPQHAHWVLRDEKGEELLQLQSLDGRELTNDVLAGLHSAILMSGTLTPLDVHRDLITLETERVKMREFDSPFPSKNRIIIVAGDVSSKMEERTEKTFERLDEYIEEILKRSGNTALFFPSYDMMGDLLSLIKTEKRILVEDKRTIQSEIVKKLSDNNENVIFGVSGGKLSEGVDYPGELLTCVVMVGFPYADWNDQQRALIEYMESSSPGRGRLYGYLAPAIIRMLQACGRVHRSENDVGSIIILDRRVRLPYIKRRLPNYFQREMKIVSNPEECGKLLANFWENKRAN